MHKPTWHGTERRGEIRHESDCAAYLKLVDPQAPSARFIAGRVDGVSTSGLNLTVGFIVPNEKVQIRMPDKIAFGRVRYCVHSGDDFRVGVQIVGSY